MLPEPVKWALSRKGSHGESVEFGNPDLSLHGIGTGAEKGLDS
jgi:hypothetical protein